MGTDISELGPQAKAVGATNGWSHQLYFPRNLQQNPLNGPLNR